MIRLRPLTPARLGFARRFVAAGWGVAWAAYLYDADPEALAGALGLGAAA